MSPQKPKKSRKEAVADSSAVSRVLVLFEQMQGRFAAVLDAVVINRRALEEKIERLDANITSEIATLTTAVRYNSEEIRSLRHDMQQKADRAELALLEYRVAVLEKRVGVA